MTVWDTDNPRPVPRGRSLVVKKGLKICSSVRSGIPPPVSRTSSSTPRPAFSARVTTVILPLASVASIAFRSKAYEVAACKVCKTQYGNRGHRSEFDWRLHDDAVNYQTDESNLIQPPLYNVTC